MGVPTALRCLGGPTLLDAAGAPVRLKSQKQLALLIYLMLEGRSPVRRDRLADLLWSEVGLREARHSMGTALWGLKRRVSPTGFRGDRNTIWTTVELECDVDRLLRGEILATEFVPALEVDAFLEEFEIADAPAFNLWRDQKRVELWPRIEEALVRQMDHCRRTGDFTGITRLADRTVRHNPLSEAAIRARIEARIFAGDRIGALRAFETWKRTLQEELHAEPSESLESMARRLRRGTPEGGGDGNRPRVPTEQWKDRPFIGRAAEYRTLYEAWERTTRGEPTHALVLGESGIGKSTLIQRLMTAASLDGAVTSRVQCYELERDIPYAALGALVRGLLERPETRGTSPQSLADLAQAVPAIAEQFRHLPPALELQGESFRIRITDAMESLVRTVAEETAVMLVVDDFHMADDASAAVVHLLVRRFEQERVMVALAARPTGPSESPNIAKLRESHRRLGFVSLEVPPMSAEEAMELLDGLTEDGVAPGKAVRDAILRAAGGYPMALELFVGEWASSGESSLALAVPAMREELGQRPPPEDAYRLALDRIYEGLDAPTRLVLQLGAVLGPRLNELSMYQVVDLGIGATGQAMGALRSARLLRETEERLEFVNELIRGHAYLSIPKPMRTALHGEVVTRLLAEEARGGHAPGLEIAWHLIRAGRRDEATPYLLRGARESMRGGAPHEAERGLSTAMDRLEEPDKSEALLLLGEALQEQGRMEESIGVFDRVSEPALPEVRARKNVLRLYATTLVPEDGVYAGEETIVALMREATGATNSNTRLRALWIAASLSNSLAATSWNVPIQRQIEREDWTRLSLEDKGEYALGVAYCQYLAGKKQLGKATISNILSQLQSHGISNSITIILSLGLGVLEGDLGDYTREVEVLEEAFRMARKVGDDRRQRIIAANIALAQSRIGDTEAQLKWSLVAEALPPAATGLFTFHQIYLIQARAYAVQGRQAEAFAALKAGRDSGALVGGQFLSQAWHLRAADVVAILGHRRGALAEAKLGVTGDNQLLGSDKFAGPFARWSAQAANEGWLESGLIRDQLISLRAREHSLDQIDRFEILNAKVWLDTKLGCVVESERQELRERLGTVPPGALRDYQLMGMLEIP